MNSIAPAGDSNNMAQNLPQQTLTTRTDSQISDRRFQSGGHSSSVSSVIRSSSSNSSSTNTLHFKKRNFDDGIGDNEKNLENYVDSPELWKILMPYASDSPDSNNDNDKKACLTAVIDNRIGIDYWQHDDLPQSMSNTATPVSAISQNTSSVLADSNILYPKKVRRIDHLAVRNCRSEPVNLLMTTVNNEKDEYEAQVEYDKQSEKIEAVEVQCEIWKAEFRRRRGLTLQTGEL